MSAKNYPVVENLEHNIENLIFYTNLPASYQLHSDLGTHLFLIIYYYYYKILCRPLIKIHDSELRGQAAMHNH